jgi:hypothetical protein
MSRSFLFLNNKSKNYVVVTGFRGDEWVNQGVYINTVIPPGGKVEVGAMGEPGHDESDHWGWVYLYDQQLKLPMQLYLHLKADLVREEQEASAGLAAPVVSSASEPQPAPWDAAFGTTRGDTYVYSPPGRLLPAMSALDAPSTSYYDVRLAANIAHGSDILNQPCTVLFTFPTGIIHGPYSGQVLAWPQPNEITMKALSPSLDVFWVGANGGLLTVNPGPNQLQFAINGFTKLNTPSDVLTSARLTA